MKPPTSTNAAPSVNIFPCALRGHIETPSTASGHEYVDGDVTYGGETLLGSPYENSLYKKIEKKNVTKAEERTEKGTNFNNSTQLTDSH
jgi:hypothetical protein